jgi:hypothetical protein
MGADRKLLEIQNAGAEIRLAYGLCGAACESFGAPRGAFRVLRFGR